MGVSNRVLRKLQVSWKGVLPRVKGGYPFYNRVRMGPGSVGLFLAFVFLWTSLLMRSSVEMTGMSGRGSGEVTGTGATWTLG